MRANMKNREEKKKERAISRFFNFIGYNLILFIINGKIIF